MLHFGVQWDEFMIHKEQLAAALRSDDEVRLLLSSGLGGGLFTKIPEILAKKIAK